MTRSLRTACFALILAAFTVTAAHAQGTAVVTGKVTTAADGLPLPGASVSIAALKLTAETAADGTYKIEVPAPQAKGQTVEIRVTFPGLQPQSANIALSNSAVARDFELVFGFHEEITVGSRLAGAAAEKAVPVDVFTAQQIT